MVDQWNFSLVFVRLVHRNMEKHLGSQDLARFPPADPSWESPAISLEHFNVSSYVGEEGHIEEVDISYLNIPLYLNTFIRGTHKLWGDSDPPMLGIQRIPRLRDPHGPPL
jgi:hypothetical protein